MGQSISELEPARVFRFFDEITKIPRGSGNEKAISDYLVDFANTRGLLAYQDEYNNVTILKPGTAGMEDKETVILQAHMDMVCIADKDATSDPSKDPIDVYIDGDHIKARGTTLGADDGIGMALILAVLDSSDVAHPMIEAVFTADEEVGLNGANGYDCSRLKGKRFINLDSEEEYHLVIGCAGGCKCDISSKCKTGKVEGVIYELEISGLTGGHSGVEIHKGNANANSLMGWLFTEALDSVEMNLGTYEGGIKDNAICSEAVATVVVKKKHTKTFEKIVKAFSETVSMEYCGTDPELTVTCRDKGKGKLEVMSAKDFKKFASLLTILPHGVDKMSQIADMVEASSNLAIVSAKPKSFKICESVRSNKEATLELLLRRIEMIADSFGVLHERRGYHPAWETDGISDFARSAKNLYETMFPGRRIDIIAIHAGLECAVFSQKIKGLDSISIGPDMEGVHSPSERLSISSTKREWEFLKELLKL